MRSQQKVSFLSQARLRATKDLLDVFFPGFHAYSCVWISVQQCYFLGASTKKSSMQNKGCCCACNNNEKKTKLLWLLFGKTVRIWILKMRSRLKVSFLSLRQDLAKDLHDNVFFQLSCVQLHVWTSLQQFSSYSEWKTNLSAFFSHWVSDCYSSNSQA